MKTARSSIISYVRQPFPLLRLAARCARLQWLNYPAGRVCVCESVSKFLRLFDLLGFETRFT